MEKTIAQYTFSSKFDSGNLTSIQALNKSTFEAWISPDCEGTRFQNHYRTWFYFSVKGGRTGETIQIRLKNMNNQAKLYRHDFRPVFRSIPSRTRWARLEYGVIFLDRANDTIELRFSHQFVGNDELTFFAFCTPYSYTDLQRDLAGMFNDENLEDSHVYLHRELLCYSAEGHRLDLLTISSNKGISAKRHSKLTGAGLHPDSDDKRSQRFPGKPVIFLSARVHPGETPASHMLKGCLEFLLQDDPRAVALRDHFVFKVIPMLNPDGVSRGHYRTDTFGQNLNRCYIEPSHDRHPTIFATVKEIEYLNKHANLHSYIDLHAHASKRGVFMFGNSLGNDTPEMVDNVLLTKLMTINSPHFDFKMCCFAAKKMDIRDRNGDSKAGSGRVSIHRRTGLTRCYTLEANYNAAKEFFAIPSLPTGSKNKQIAVPYRKVCSPGLMAFVCVNNTAEDDNENAAKKHPPRFCRTLLEGVGKALVISLLDLEAVNQWSRLPHSRFKDISGLRNWVERHLRIKQMKRPKRRTPKSAARLKGAAKNRALRRTAAASSNASNASDDRSSKSRDEFIRDEGDDLARNVDQMSV